MDILLWNHRVLLVHQLETHSLDLSLCRLVLELIRDIKRHTFIASRYCHARCGLNGADYLVGSVRPIRNTLVICSACVELLFIVQHIYAVSNGEIAVYASRRPQPYVESVPLVLTTVSIKDGALDASEHGFDRFRKSIEYRRKAARCLVRCVAEWVRWFRRLKCRERSCKRVDV